MTSETLPLSAVDEYAESYIAQRLSTVEGVAQVLVFGAQKFAIRIQVDPNRLASMGVGFDDVENAVSAANSNNPVGSLSGAQKTRPCRHPASSTTPRNTTSLSSPIGTGSPVKLGDVGRVLNSVENNKTASWLNGQRSIVLAIQRQPDANTVEVIDQIRALLPKIQEEIPASVHVRP